jgi:hypothetical protein
MHVCVGGGIWRGQGCVESGDGWVVGLCVFGVLVDVCLCLMCVGIWSRDREEGGDERSASFWSCEVRNREREGERERVSVKEGGWVGWEGGGEKGVAWEVERKRKRRVFAHV